MKMLYIYIINITVILTAVGMHYEVLYRLSITLPKLSIRYRYRVLVGIIGAFIAHSAEVWLFAFAYLFIIGFGSFGGIYGIENPTLMDCVYFSFVNYTTLGYGDITPHGLVRFTAGLEALTGLLLIAWTASFMYYEIRKYWEA